MTQLSRLVLAISAAALAFNVAVAPAAFAADDKMMKDDAMKKGAMSHDGMKKDSMAKDGMKKDDAMSKDGMKKEDGMMKKN